MSKAASAAKTGGRKSSGYRQFQKIFGSVIMAFYHLRKVFMAIPVVYYAFKIAIYNSEQLPVEVGLFLQNSGDFLWMFSRNAAVFWPLVLTLACVFLMFFTRKAMYSWAVSIFTLALPLLLLFSNRYPA